MKVVGIDYGTKRVGVAVSDPAGLIAFPRMALVNDRTLIPTLRDFILKEGVAEIVVGESKNNDGRDNPVMTKVRQFSTDIARETGIAVQYEPEFYTSVEARRTSENRLVDAEAAAIILNSYLTKKHGHNR